MDPIIGSALIGSGISAASSGIGAWLAHRNREETYAREDNAVQRRAADLEAAGLSRNLAAGSPAQASASNIQMGPGMIDAANMLKEIPMQKAQRELVEANKNNPKEQNKALQYQNQVAGLYSTWLGSPDPLAPKGPDGRPIWNNAQSQQDMYSRELETERITNGFFNKFGLPNQPGVLQSQTGQVLLLNQAWQNMNSEERGQFLKAYGATTLADISGNLLGSAAGSFGGSFGKYAGTAASVNAFGPKPNVPK